LEGAAREHDELVKNLALARSELLKFQDLQASFEEYKMQKLSDDKKWTADASAFANVIDNLNKEKQELVALHNQEKQVILAEHATKIKMLESKSESSVASQEKFQEVAAAHDDLYQKYVLLKETHEATNQQHAKSAREGRALSEKFDALAKENAELKECNKLQQESLLLAEKKMEIISLQHVDLTFQYDGLKTNFNREVARAVDQSLTQLRVLIGAPSSTNTKVTAVSSSEVVVNASQQASQQMSKFIPEFVTYKVEFDAMRKNCDSLVADRATIQNQLAAVLEDRKVLLGKIEEITRVRCEEHRVYVLDRTLKRMGSLGIWNFWRDWQQFVGFQRKAIVNKALMAVQAEQAERKRAQNHYERLEAARLEEYRKQEEVHRTQVELF
jgi:hypothetical protein